MASLGTKADPAHCSSSEVEVEVDERGGGGWWASRCNKMKQTNGIQRRRPRHIPAIYCELSSVGLPEPRVAMETSAAQAHNIPPVNGGEQSGFNRGHLFQLLETLMVGSG